MFDLCISDVLYTKALALLCFVWSLKAWEMLAESIDNSSTYVYVGVLSCIKKKKFKTFIIYFFTALQDNFLI